MIDPNHVLATNLYIHRHSHLYIHTHTHTASPLRLYHISHTFLGTKLSFSSTATTARENHMIHALSPKYENIDTNGIFNVFCFIWVTVVTGIRKLLYYHKHHVTKEKKIFNRKATVDRRRVRVKKKKILWTLVSKWNTLCFDNETVNGSPALEIIWRYQFEGV